MQNFQTLETSDSVAEPPAEQFQIVKTTGDFSISQTSGFYPYVTAKEECDSISEAKSSRFAKQLKKKECAKFLVLSSLELLASALLLAIGLSPYSAHQQQMNFRNTSLHLGIDGLTITVIALPCWLGTRYSSAAVLFGAATTFSGSLFFASYVVTSVVNEHLKAAGLPEALFVLCVSILIAVFVTQILLSVRFFCIKLGVIFYLWMLNCTIYTVKNILYCTRKYEHLIILL